MASFYWIGYAAKITATDLETEKHLERIMKIKERIKKSKSNESDNANNCVIRNPSNNDNVVHHCY